MKIVLLSVVAALWLVTTGDQVRLWSGPEVAMWLNAAHVAPAKPRPWINLGRQYAFLGHTQLASNAFQAAIDLSDQRPRTERAVSRSIAITNRARLTDDFIQWLTRLD